MSTSALNSMNFVDAIANTLLEIQSYIVHYNFRIDDATWFAFDDHLWIQLPHAIYASSIVQLPTSTVTVPGSITASP